MRVSLLKSGFTMVEVLVSLLIVSIALAAIAPALALSVLSRVHSQRLEQAGFLARQELDRVRAIVDNGASAIGSKFDELPVIAGNTTAFMAADNTLIAGSAPDFTLPFSNVAPPRDLDKNTVQCWKKDSPDQLFPCDAAIMSNPETQYIIQLFRDEGLPCLDSSLDPITITAVSGETFNLPCFFNMGVRVYHMNSFDRSALKPIFETEWDNATTVGTIAALEPFLRPVPAIITGAKSLATIQRAPLVVLTGEVGSVASLRDYCNSLAADPAVDCAF